MPSNGKALLSATIAGALFVGGVFWWQHGGSDSPRAGCETVVVAASSDKASVMQEAADRYNSSDRKAAGTCYGIKIQDVASGVAEARLAEADWDQSWGRAPDAWAPGATTWLQLLRHDRSSYDRRDILPADIRSAASSPVILAMPEPMARALGWPRAHLGWSNLLSLANDPRGWAAVGHPEWGRFKLGKTNPNVSTSGLAATVGTLVAATGTSSDLTMGDLSNRRVRDFAAGVERSVVHYGDTTLTYLANLQRADDAGAALTYVSAVAVEEKSVIDYNEGNPKGDLATKGQHRKPRIPLVAIYPKEGTLVSDHPFAILDAPWSDAGRRAGAEDFLDYLREPAQQKLFTDEGFRSFDRRPGTAVSGVDYLREDIGVVLAAPSPPVLSAVRETWAQLRKPAHVLLVMDVSGSMGMPAGGGRTRLERAQAAAVKGLAQLADTDEVGLWVFPAGNGNDVYSQLSPVAPLGPQRQQMIAKIGQLSPSGGTPLYSVTRKASEAVRAGARTDTINAIVVMTDGRNEYPEDDDLTGLLRQLDEQSIEGGIRVFTIAYGQDADLDTATRISEASRAAAYDATDPRAIDAVFTNVLSNF